MRNNRRITTSEKTLFFVTGFAIVMILALGAWRQWVDAVPNLKIPTPAMPSPNAYDFYVQAGKAIIPAPFTVDPGKMSTGTLKKRYPTSAKEAWLRRNAPALNVFRQGFKYLCRVPPQRSSMSNPFRNNGKFLEIARMLRLESNAHSERGEWTEAAESALDIVKLGHDTARGGILTNYLTSTSINKIGRFTLWEILPHLSAVELRSNLERLKKIRQKHVTYAGVLREEKHYGQAVILELVQLDGWRTGPLRKASGLKKLGDLWQTTTISRRTVLNNYASYMDSLIAEAGKPYAIQDSLSIKPKDILSQFVGFVGVNTPWLYAYDETGNNQLLIVLALRCYNFDHNRYPHNLKELIPQYLDTIPVDPYGNGAFMRYQTASDGYRLYSIGPDGIDNQGRAIENPNYPQEKRNRFVMKPKSKGDFVAGINF